MFHHPNKIIYLEIKLYFGTNISLFVHSHVTISLYEHRNIIIKFHFLDYLIPYFAFQAHTHFNKKFAQHKKITDIRKRNTR